MRFSIPSLAAFSAVALFIIATPAFADQVKYTADLTASAETPPTDTTGTGTVDATYDTDTKMLSWTVTYQGLTGDVTAAHFHGPAAVGAKADPVVPLSPPYTSPASGSATLTDQQAADLKAGMWYFNLHTAKYPDGEVRGQLVQGGVGGASSTAMSEASSAMSSSAMSTMSSDASSSSGTY
jgi:hypothetical protein